MSEFEQVVESGVSKFKKGLRKFFWILLALIAIGLAGFVWVSNWTYSKGTRSGYIVKVTKKGVIWKTYEGQLNLGGVQTDVDQGGLMGNIWDFSVPSRDIYDQLSQYEGKQVRLSYRQVYNNMPWQGKTSYMVTGVVPIKKARE